MLRICLLLIINGMRACSGSSLARAYIHIARLRTPSFIAIGFTHFFRAGDERCSRGFLCFIAAVASRALFVSARRVAYRAWRRMVGKPENILYIEGREARHQRGVLCMAALAALMLSGR